MSNDARYIIKYDPAVVFGSKQPQQAIDELNSLDYIHWDTPLHKIDSYEFMGETKHTWNAEVIERSKADQILVSYDGDNWVDITPKIEPQPVESVQDKAKRLTLERLGYDDKPE